MAIPKTPPRQNGGVGMFSGGVSRAVNYVTMGLALAFIAAHPSFAMESMPVGVVDVQSALRITIKATPDGLPTTVPLQWDNPRLIGQGDHALRTTELRLFPKEIRP